MNLATSLPTTALCLHGYIGNFLEAWPSLKQYVIDPYSPDVFAFVWSNTTGKFARRLTKNNLNCYSSIDYIQSSCISSIVDVINSKLITVQDQTTLDLMFDTVVEKYATNKDWHMPKSFYHHAWSQQQCVALKKTWERARGRLYDQVIVSRWDMIYHDSIDSSYFESSKLSIPQTTDRWWGPSDAWAMGPSHLIDIYSNRFDNIETISQNSEMLKSHPYQFLDQMLSHYKIPYDVADIAVKKFSQ